MCFEFPQLQKFMESTNLVNFLGRNPRAVPAAPAFLSSFAFFMPWPDFDQSRVNRSAIPLYERKHSARMAAQLENIKGCKKVLMELAHCMRDMKCIKEDGLPLRDCVLDPRMPLKCKKLKVKYGLCKKGQVRAKTRATTSLGWER